MLLLVLGDWRAVSGALNPRALLRAAGETLSVLCYIVALARLPIADVIALLQTAPLALVLGAAFLLKERVGALRLVLVLVGFAGALMVAQPGAGGVSPAALFAFASALLIAARDLVGRGVPARIPVMVVTFATNLMVMTAGFFMSLGVETWVAPKGWHLAFLGSPACSSPSGMWGSWSPTASAAPPRWRRSSTVLRCGGCCRGCWSGGRCRMRWRWRGLR